MNGNRGRRISMAYRRMQRQCTHIWVTTCDCDTESVPKRRNMSRTRCNTLPLWTLQWTLLREKWSRITWNTLSKWEVWKRMPTDQDASRTTTTATLVDRCAQRTKTSVSNFTSSHSIYLRVTLEYFLCQPKENIFEFWNELDPTNLCWVISICLQKCLYWNKNQIYGKLLIIVSRFIMFLNKRRVMIRGNLSLLTRVLFINELNLQISISMQKNMYPYNEGFLINGRGVSELHQ